MHQLGIPQHGHGHVFRVLRQEGIPGAPAPRQVVQRLVAQHRGQSALRHEFPGPETAWEKAGRMWTNSGTIVENSLEHWENVGKI